MIIYFTGTGNGEYIAKEVAKETNDYGIEYIAMQVLLLTVGIVIFLLMTVLSYRRACVHFERIDL